MAVDPKPRMTDPADSSEPRSQSFGALLNDEGMRTVLEMVGGNKPLAQVLDTVAQLVERQIPGTDCELFFQRSKRSRHKRKSRLSSIASTSGDLESTRQLIALARGVCIESGSPAHTWSLKVRSRNLKVIGKLVFSHTTSHPLDEYQAKLIETAMRLAILAVQHRHLHAELHNEATTDRATGLPNRDAFERRLTRFIRRSKPASPAAVVWIRLERFKDIDATVGYRTTDALLQFVGQRIGVALTPGQWLARVGSDEFAVFCEEAGAETARRCAQQIIHALEPAFVVNRYAFSLNARIGIALYPDHGTGALALQQNAAAAATMPVVANNTRWAFYEAEPALGLRKRRQTEHELRRAIENQELLLFYQPQVDLDQRLVAMEALIRWKHPKLGILDPDQFIPLAEETGLIVPIGTWVIREACRQCANWARAVDLPIKVGVNISALQLYFSDLPELVAASLQKEGVPASCFEIELTETAVMRNADESAKALQKLRDLGVTVAIDDFGTGYSSLSYLQRIPADLLKIDRSFLQQIHAGRSAAVVRAITALGHSLGLRIVAEGVETKEQFDHIRGIGVDIAQGFLIGRPMPASRALAWMAPQVVTAVR